jgi:copper chaperone CopZ
MKRLPFMMLLSWLAFVPFLQGQVEISSGDLTGVLLNKDQPLASAVITLRDPARGFRRQTVSDGSGQFRIAGLAPAVYEAEVSCAGCVQAIVRNLEIRVGEILSVEISMDRVSDVSARFSIDVAAKPPVIETHRTQQSNSVDAGRLQNLPINLRDYLSFALLSPGVVDSTSLVDDDDFRVAQSPQSGLSIGGNNGRGNTFAIDGISNDYNSGGVRPSISQ